MENPIWSYFFKTTPMREELIKLMKRLPVFQGLSDHELKYIEHRLKLRKFKKGESVMGEGNPGACMYIVKSGSVVIKKDLSEDKKVELARISEEQFFGEVALMDEVTRSASAVTETETELLALSRPDIEKLKPGIAIKVIKNIARVISARLIKTNQQLEQLDTQVKEKEKEIESLRKGETADG